MFDDRDSFWPEPPSDTDWAGGDDLPAMPAWLLDGPRASDLLSVPDCPCCLEPAGARR